MKLRDKIALEMLKIYVAAECNKNGLTFYEGDDFPMQKEINNYNEELSKAAYAIADAMMRVREE